MQSQPQSPSLQVNYYGGSVLLSCVASRPRSMVLACKTGPGKAGVAQFGFHTGKKLRLSRSRPRVSHCLKGRCMSTKVMLFCRHLVYPKHTYSLNRQTPFLWLSGHRLFERSSKIPRQIQTLTLIAFLDKRSSL